MQRHFRVSPSVVLATLSLVVAVSSLLYVMERPGTIAIGSPFPDGVRVIDAGVVGKFAKGWSRDQHCAINEVVELTVWSREDRTVPEGKKWLVILAPGMWHLAGEISAREMESRVEDIYSTVPLGFVYEFEYFDPSIGWTKRDVLHSGTYEALELGIFNCGERKDGNGWAWVERPVVYLVLEVDE